MKKIYLPGLNSTWVIKQEFLSLKNILLKKNYNISDSKIAFNSIVYLPSQYSLSKSYYHIFKNKVVLDYFHGNPNSDNSFYENYKNLFNFSRRFDRIRVTHREIFDLLDKDTLKGKIYKIPLGIDIKNFNYVNLNKKLSLRKKLNIPQEAFVIGSFQKDGSGWGKGNEPKKVKGPDILINAIKLLNKKIKNLFILLLGPSRGYVVNKLKENKINFLHYQLNESDYLNIESYYNCLDAYLITSRQEGGPKSLLESMACKIPVVSTNVGQAQDLLINNENGFKVDSFEAEEIADKVFYLYNNQNNVEIIKENGRHTAETNDYTKQLNLWADFFHF
tara:strand:- start:3077 stop:4075 length:999 start_codon:yes stop_codon:yes gene_type:complete